MKVKTSIVEELFESESKEFFEGWAYVATADRDKGRWSSYHWLVLEEQASGDFWAISYSMGLTENQEHDFPWHETWSETPEELELFRVYPEAVATIEWKELKKL